MVTGLLLPLIAAVAVGWLPWWRETRHFDEPRGWDTTEEEFRRQVIEQRKRRRVSAMVIGALAGSAAAGLVLQAAGLSAGGSG